MTSVPDIFFRVAMSFSRWVMRCRVPLVAGLIATPMIGPGLLPAQSRQGEPIDVLRVENRNELFRDQFRELLGDSQPSSWPAGWRLAQKMGSSAAPLLAAIWEEEGSNLTSRLLFLGAHSLAAGPEGEPTYGSSLSRLDDQEKVMALLILASGPPRTRAIDGLARLTDRREKIAVRVAAYLALARLGVEAPPLRADRDDPGLLAAALYAELSVSDRELRTWFRDGEGQDPSRHLVRRGFLLADPEPDPDRDRRLAWAAQEAGGTLSGPGFREARRAAALCLARLGDPAQVLVDLPDPDPELVLILATEPRMRSSLPLDPVPGGLIDLAERQRLAVLYVLQESPATVLATADRWVRDEDIRGSMCLALTISLLDGVQGAVSVPDSVTALPEGAWVQWAAGEQPAVPTGVRNAGDPAGDEILARALPLALDGRLPREVAHRVIEAALWRSGSHPGLVRVEAHVALLRDLLMSGSTQVSAALGIEALDQYLPAGIPRTDRRFFEIAYGFLQFVAVPREIPETLRLRLR